MAALAPGKTAPDFALPSMVGKTFSLRESLARGPVVLAFFKISCPVCQYAFPFLERIYQTHVHNSVTIVGVSQNEKKHTSAFLKEYGINFPVLLDDPVTFSVSHAYGLTNVPTIYWIAPEGKIEISSVGFSRADLEEINRRAAETAEELPPVLFGPEEQVPEYRPG